MPDLLPLSCLAEAFCKACATAASAPPTGALTVLAQAQEVRLDICSVSLHVCSNLVHLVLTSGVVFCSTA
jgi:hypothetical protein